MKEVRNRKLNCNIDKLYYFYGIRRVDLNTTLQQFDQEPDRICWGYSQSCKVHERASPRICNYCWLAIGKLMPEKAKSEQKKIEKGMVLKSQDVQTLLKTMNLPDGQVLPDWPKILASDYVNAIVLNDTRQAMIFERSKHGHGMSSWQVVEGFVEEGEDPLIAIQRALLADTGYSSEDWLYLGSYMLADVDRRMGVGHFFCAQNAQQVTHPLKDNREDWEIRWVSRRELKYALLDGRISVLSYAITISMSLLTVLD